MPLTMAPVGAEVTVKRVLADERSKRHFSDLGIAEGTKLTVFSSVQGNVIVKVCEAWLALNSQLKFKFLILRTPKKGKKRRNGRQEWKRN